MDARTSPLADYSFAVEMQANSLGKHPGTLRCAATRRQAERDPTRPVRHRVRTGPVRSGESRRSSVVALAARLAFDGSVSVETCDSREPARTAHQVRVPTQAAGRDVIR